MHASDVTGVAHASDVTGVARASDVAGVAGVEGGGVAGVGNRMCLLWRA